MKTISTLVHARGHKDKEPQWHSWIATKCLGTKTQRPAGVEDNKPDCLATLWSKLQVTWPVPGKRDQPPDSEFKSHGRSRL